MTNNRRRPRRPEFVNAPVRRRLAQLALAGTPQPLVNGESSGRPQAAPCCTDFDGVFNRESLLNVYKEKKRKARADRDTDSLSSEHFSTTEIANALEDLCEAIRDYRAQPSAIVQIPRGDGRIRELRVRPLLDRVVSTAANNVLSQIAEQHLLPSCIGFRPGQSTWNVMVGIERAVTHGRCFIAQDDIRNAFDSVPTGTAIDACRSRFQDPRWQRLVRAILLGYNLDRTMGIDQGDALSPVALNLVMHSVLDLPLYAAGWGSPLYLRYADNLVVLGHSALDVRQVLDQARLRLAEHGMVLKAEDGPPICLTRPGAKVTILGLVLSLENGRLMYRIGDAVWTGLRDKLECAWDAPDPRENARNVIQSWLEGYGAIVEGVGLEHLIRRLHVESANAGHHERPTSQEMCDWARNAQDRWEEFRQNNLA